MASLITNKDLDDLVHRMTGRTTEENFRAQRSKLKRAIEGKKISSLSIFTELERSQATNHYNIPNSAWTRVKVPLHETRTKTSSEKKMLSEGKKTPNKVPRYRLSEDFLMDVMRTNEK